ncbi:MAG: hypothetical protein JW904_05130 [Spirochaetales bacterium]|nr:hypothetical protein [Spirochaetales bacterium]
MLILPACLHAENTTSEAEIPVRKGLFSDFGLGAGLFSFDNDVAEIPANFTFGIESRIGVHINEHLSLFLFTHVNFMTFSTIVDFSKWVYEDPENETLRVLLTPFIPIALFFESQIFVGPGIRYYTFPSTPSLYFEGGMGYSGIQSISMQTFIMGGGLFTGFGVEITPHISCGVRLIYSPSFLHSGWTPSNKNFFSMMAFLYIT